MRRIIEHYNGIEITQCVIDRVRNIVRSRTDGELIDCEWINSLDDICVLHDSKPDDEHIILGKDWVIAYSITDVLEIGLWAASEKTTDKFLQVMEMLKTMKCLLLENSDYEIHACMRHSTSYRFYESFVNRDFLYEIFDNVNVDGGGKVKNASPDLIFHDTVFCVSDNFLKHYKKK